MNLDFDLDSALIPIRTLLIQVVIKVKSVGQECPTHIELHGTVLLQKPVHLHDVGIALANGREDEFSVRGPGDAAHNESAFLPKVGYLS